MFAALVVSADLQTSNFEINLYFSTSAFWSLMEPAVYRRAGGMILAQRQVPIGWNYCVIETHTYFE
jgi:hypothetical protein